MNINPMKICTHLNGIENVNDVRDCVIDSIRRFYGPMCVFHEAGIYETVQTYLIQILENAGKNPKAVKLSRLLNWRNFLWEIIK